MVKRRFATQPYKVDDEASITFSHLEAAVAVPGLVNDGIHMPIYASRTVGVHRN